MKIIEPRKVMAMDDLEIIHRTIEEHHKVRGNIRLVGEAVNDMEAILGLQQSHANWGQSSAGVLPDALERLQRSISGLNEGLRNHFGFEERYLPPVLGPNLMKALIFDHDEIRQKLASSGASIVADLKSSSRDDLLTFRNKIQHIVGDLTITIENHASHEEIVLGMLERALKRESDEKGKAQSET